MAYVVARPKRRFEIRESRSTPRGSRSRTLATFAVLDEDVLDHAEARAERPFDRAAVVEKAKRLEVPVAPPRADILLRDLAIHLDQATPSPTFAAMVRSVLRGPAEDAHLREAEDYVGLSPEERGNTLVDLLGVLDAMPWINRFPGPRFPRVDGRR